MRCCRQINWQDHISNIKVRRQVQRECRVMDTIRQRKLQLFGHICRMSDDRLLKSLVFGMVEGESQPKRPVRIWINDILMWCGKDVQEAMTVSLWTAGVWTETTDGDSWLAPTVIADHGSEGRKEGMMLHSRYEPDLFNSTSPQYVTMAPNVGPRQILTKHPSMSHTWLKRRTSMPSAFLVTTIV